MLLPREQSGGPLEELWEAGRSPIAPIPNGEARLIVILAVPTEDALANMTSEDGEVGDDVRIRKSHKRHHEVSWASCICHSCPTHLVDKAKHNAFPIRHPNSSHRIPYLANELRHWSPQSKGRNHGYVILVPNVQEECLSNPMQFHNCQNEDCEVHRQAKVHNWHQALDATQRREEQRIQDRMVYIQRMRSREPSGITS
ncbi:hypothetical protein EDB80DRAFT_684024 [Ilyonectria destructans]|nr:hypothetical protein EDB80DRAFT_684024 [Ilyonectria destructans]